MMTDKMPKKNSLRYDIILISALLVLALGVSFVMILTREEGNYVEVELDGKLVATYSLEDAGEYILNGGTNILVIKHFYI